MADGIVVCPACSNVMPHDRRFCTRCGLDLTAHKKGLESRHAVESAKKETTGAGEGFVASVKPGFTAPSAAAPQSVPPPPPARTASVSTFHNLQ